MTLDAPVGRRATVGVTHIALLLLFAGGGSAALIYEIVWLQLLELFIGSSSISLGILLATFMGGMCVGSLLVPRMVSARHHPLEIYAALEAAVSGRPRFRDESAGCNLPGDIALPAIAGRGVFRIQGDA
jgi:hypothetical protein